MRIPSPPARRAPAVIAILAALAIFPFSAGFAQSQRGASFLTVKSEQKWRLKELNPAWPSDWSDWSYLVLGMQDLHPAAVFHLWLYTASGPRRIMLQPLGQGVWLRASIPLRYFKGKDQSGFDLASTNNRRTDSFWMSIWGPCGDLKDIQSLGFTMDYPIGKPTLEIRSFQLAKDRSRLRFSGGQTGARRVRAMGHADWPRKIKSREQLEKELAAEDQTLKPGDFDYCEYGGYKSTQAKATGFFRVEQVDGKWWFVDPHGHLFLSTGSNGRAAAAARALAGTRRHPVGPAPGRLGLQHRRRRDEQALYRLCQRAARAEHVLGRARRLFRGVRAAAWTRPPPAVRAAQGRSAGCSATSSATSRRGASARAEVVDMILAGPGNRHAKQAQGIPGRRATPRRAASSSWSRRSRSISR